MNVNVDETRRHDRVAKIHDAETSRGNSDARSRATLRRSPVFHQKQRLLDPLERSEQTFAVKAIIN